MVGLMDPDASKAGNNKDVGSKEKWLVVMIVMEKVRAGFS